MTPYFAVITDSFRAAFASRVLWMALIAIWILLAALAPVGYRQDYTTDFRSQDFYNGTRLKAMLARGMVDETVSEQPIGRLAAAMPDELSRNLRRVGNGEEVRIFSRLFADALNECLDDESWYSEDAWSETLQFRELRELNELPEPLDESLRRRRARLRIEAALPGVFENRSAQSIRLSYAGVDFPARFSTDKAQFLILVNQYVLPVIIQWLMGFVLVFLGILVTASMIPEMLQPGSLHLLLSKPVSRRLLLLSKFFGGCVFVLLCVTQLVIGLYLIVGFRLDIWNMRLLWCIPVSVFLFSVFYSVSTLAGLIWRSSILAISVTSIFGCLCLVVGVIGNLFDTFVTGPAKIRNLAVVGETIIGATKGGGLVRWDDQQGSWSEILEGNPLGMDRIIAPVALGPNTVVTASVRGGRFNPFGSGATDLLVMTQDSDWEGEPSVRLPTSTTEVYLSGDKLLALNAGELASVSIDYVLSEVGAKRSATNDDEGDSKREKETGLRGPSESSSGVARDNQAGSRGWLQKLSSMMGVATEGFENLLPQQVSLTPPRNLVVDPEGGFLFVVSRGRLIRFEPPQSGSGTWEISSEASLDGDVSKNVLLAISGEVLLMAREEVPIQVFDAATLQQLGQVDLPESLDPISLVGLPGNGGFLLGSSDGRLRHVKRVGSGVFELTGPVGPREVESVHVDRTQGRVYIAHHIDRLEVLAEADLQFVEQRNPIAAGWRFLEKYFIAPARFVTPQTGELGETIEAIISGESAKTILDGPEKGEVVRYELTRPILSCSIFIAIMLTTSCYYFSTRDF